jgi:uncharacterized membrane protein YeaQ/YmgE (transglycosylase-associated protein family)
MNVDIQGLAIMAIIGIVAGYLASLIMGGGGNWLLYLLIGVVGSVLGGLLFGNLGGKLGIGNPLVSQIVTATAGAMILTFVARMAKLIG